MTDVYFFEAFKEEEEEIRKRLPGHISAGFTSETIQESGIAEIPSVLISTRTQSVIPDVWAPRMKGLLTRSTGYDHVIDYQRSTRSPAVLGYLPAYCAVAVAEQAILLMWALMRKLPAQIAQFPRFDRDGLTGRECRGKNILVVGVGNIGSEIARIALSLKMAVKGTDIQPIFKDIEYVSLKEGLSWAQVVVVALPLTEQTRGMLNYDVLKRARPGLILVNVGRGEATPLNDLSRHLNERFLGGAALDVYEDELKIAEDFRRGQTPKHPVSYLVRELSKMDNVILTPHNAFNTVESVARKAEQSVQAVNMFLEQQRFPSSPPAS